MNNSSPRKSYRQVCPVSTALDVIGDRWTLLLLRELLGGPARFNQLHEGLPGIPKNLLASRLRRLEADGLVRRLGAGALYALTERGAGIRASIEHLGFWGARLERIGAPDHGRSIRASAMALQAILTAVGSSLPDEPVHVELSVGGEPVEIALGQRPRVTVQASPNADAVLSVDADVITAYLSGQAIPEAEFVMVSGSSAARTALLDALNSMVSGTG